MYSFLILGRVPGTNITISFEVWLIIMTVIGYATYRYWPRIKQLVHDLEMRALARKPLHASQLHRRVV